MLYRWRGEFGSRVLLRADKVASPVQVVRDFISRICSDVSTQ